MKIVQWNSSKKSQPMSGVKKYEDELYARIQEQKEIELERIQRADNVILGNTVASWFLTYKAGDAGIVHATCQSIAPVALINKPKIFIVTVLDLIPLVYPSVRNKDISVKTQWLLIPKALKRVDKIIVVSGFTKREIVSLLGINESRICVIPLAVDHSKYYPKNKAECRRKFGLQENGKYILAVASNLEHKGMDLTLRVLSKIRENRPDILLLKSGYGEKLSGEGILNVGYIKEEDMPDLYNCADVFLNTSKYEGALPILEAMSCGLPVVVSNRTAIPEMVGDCGKMIDIDKENMVDLYTKEILAGLEIGIDEKALKRSRNFTWERVAEETIKVYSDVYKTVV